MVEWMEWRGRRRGREGKSRLTDTDRQPSVSDSEVIVLTLL
jgi:hypothetical protein